MIKVTKKEWVKAEGLFWDAVAENSPEAVDEWGAAFGMVDAKGELKLKDGYSVFLLAEYFLGKDIFVVVQPVFNTAHYPELYEVKVTCWDGVLGDWYSCGVLTHPDKSIVMLRGCKQAFYIRNNQLILQKAAEAAEDN